jgi:spermidine/putrescine transport system substrate-binding protein
MVIPAKAPNRAGAYQFINFILDPEVGATLSNFNKYATPNKASMAHIKPEDRDNKGIYPPEEQMGKMEFLEDVGDSARLYDETWTAIKAK